MQRYTINLIGLLAVFLSFPINALGVNLTLSDGGLMSLDWQDPDVLGSVVARRDIVGAGVEFDVRFPTNQFPDSSTRFASTRFGGTGLLAGLNLAAYDNFALKFTLVAVDGVTATGTGGGLVVGALVYDDANGYRYKPEVIDMGQFHGRSDTSITSINQTAQQDGLGFEVHMFTTSNWSATGNTVTLLIQPAPGAVAIPEPASAVLMLIGGLCLTGRKLNPHLNGRLRNSSAWAVYH